jgi:tetratricopeptide (TPR) repeat protein
LIVACRFLVLAIFAVGAWAQQQPVEPPEEDEALIRSKEYEFNPLQAVKEIKIGNYYMKKGSFRAASGRFLEASLWDPTNPDAVYRLGEAKEKMGDRKAMAAAWNKFLELAPEDKRAPALRKKLGATK